MVRKHTKICLALLVPSTVDLQVILNEVLGKYKIISGAYKIIVSNSAHTTTSFRVFVIRIIKIILDWKNCHHYQHSEAHPSRECRRLPHSPVRQLHTWGCVRKLLMKVAFIYVGLVSSVRNFFFFLSEYFFTNIYKPQDCRGRGRAFL